MDNREYDEDMACLLEHNLDIEGEMQWYEIDVTSWFEG